MDALGTIASGEPTDVTLPPPLPLPLARLTALWKPRLSTEKDPSWPRDLYLKVLGCKGLAPPNAPDTYFPPDLSTTTTASNSTTASISHISAIFAAVRGGGGSTSFAPCSPCRDRSGTNTSLNEVAEGSEHNASSAYPGRGDGAEGSEQESDRDGPPGVVVPQPGTSDKARGGSSPDEKGSGRMGLSPRGGSKREGFAERDEAVAEEGQGEDGDEEDEDDEEDEGFGGRPEAVQCGVERDLDWVVRVTNTNTGNDLHVSTGSLTWPGFNRWRDDERLRVLTLGGARSVGRKARPGDWITPDYGDWGMTGSP